MIGDSSMDQQASGTAMATAFMRALGASDPRESIRGKDSLAEIFLIEEQKKPLRDPAARAWVMQNKVAPGAYEFMIADGILRRSGGAGIEGQCAPDGDPRRRLRQPTVSF